MIEKLTDTACLVLLAALVAAGCGENPPGSAPPGDEAAAPGEAAAAGGEAGAAGGGAAADMAPPSNWSSDWSRVGDTRVRVDGAQVRKPIMLSAVDKEYEGQFDELVVWVTVENLSRTEPLEYQRWEILARPGTKLVDETGREYPIRTFSTTKVKGGVKGGTATIPPGGPPLTDVLLFERPAADAGELRLTLGPQSDDGGPGYQFQIPASAWKR